MTKVRFFSASVMIGGIIVVIFNPWLSLIAVCAITVCGLYEFFTLIKGKGIPIYSYTGIMIGLTIPILTFFKFELTADWELFFVVTALLLVFILQFARKDNRNAIVGISTTIFGVIYISWFLSFFVKLRVLLPGIEGVKLVAFILLVTKVGDMGALFVGKSFGKHPLLPRISPNKSVEGAIGNIVFSFATAVSCQSFLPPQLGYSWVHVGLMGMFFGGLGLLGDLSESLIKRDCQVKDSGTLLPGIGGVLDTIDSVLFATPAFYLYISWALGMVATTIP